MKSVVATTLVLLLVSLSLAGCENRSHGMTVGAPPPDFTLPDIDGGAVTLSELRGKAVLLDFWFLG